ncbi:MAG: sigma factor [Nitrospira sp.]
MGTQSSSLVRTEITASNDIPRFVGTALTLTYVQIADLFHQYRDELTRRVVSMVKSHETAADLVQDTYLRLLRLGEQHVVEQPRALLHRIAANLAIDHLRKEKHVVQALDGLDAAMAVPCQAPSPEAGTHWQAAISRFSSHHRESPATLPGSVPALPRLWVLLPRNRGENEHLGKRRGEVADARARSKLRSIGCIR